MRKLSVQKRIDIVSALNQGLTVREVAEILGVGKSTVQRICEKECPNITKSKGGRPEKLSPRMKNIQ